MRDRDRSHSHIYLFGLVLAVVGVLACVTVAHASAIIDAPNSTGLVGWWKFDDGSGTTARDWSGQGNTGTLVNSPTWVVGKIGGALSFNGSNQYIAFSPTSVAGLNKGAISIWIKMPVGSTGGDSVRILAPILTV